MPSEIGVYGDIILFGIRVTFECNEHAALNDILAAYSPWSDPRFLQPAPAVYIVIESRGTSGDDIPDRMDVNDVHLHIARDGIVVRANGAEGHGRCDYPRDTTGGEALAEAINTVVLFLVGHAGRIPLHASAVMLGDTAIVFAGASGSGKSSLALAASRADLPVLSDDTIFVQVEPRLRIWSLARAIHVFEKDAPRGMEGGMRFRSGRWKKSLAIATPRQMANSAIVCLLERGGGAALAPMAEEAAVNRLTANPEPGYEFYGERSAIAARALVRGGAWRLTLSGDPAEAIALVRAIFSRNRTDQARPGIA